jgi:hypothetical protein
LDAREGTRDGALPPAPAQAGISSQRQIKITNDEPSTYRLSLPIHYHGQGHSSAPANVNAIDIRQSEKKLRLT